MIDLTFVERLIRALDESGLDTLELERGGTRVRLSKSPAKSHGVPDPSVATADSQAVTTVLPQSGSFKGGAASGPVSVATSSEGGEGDEEERTDGLLEVTSPMVGTFYAAPAPDADPYVEVGQRVGQGTVLCIIEAMKLMNELESEVEGTVAKIMVENGQPVEYGQVLFLIEPA
jgi:acetyl-CoA carboxylase biotin carboxyl carrier protein